LVKYGFWGREEAKMKEKPSTMEWDIVGDKPMSKEIALETRIKFTKQFEGITIKNQTLCA